MSEPRGPDFEPPMACVSRVIKAALPDNILVTKDARQAFVRAAGIFIFYLTHCSNDFCRESNRSTIFPKDVIAALRFLIYIVFDLSHKKYANKSLHILFATGNLDSKISKHLLKSLWKVHVL
jgi:histone H3/H4